MHYPTSTCSSEGRLLPAREAKRASVAKGVVVWGEPVADGGRVMAWSPGAQATVLLRSLLSGLGGRER